MSEFKHCPYCNGSGRIVSVSGFKSDRYRVVCDSCGASTRECETEQEAVSAWDMRAAGGLASRKGYLKTSRKSLSVVSGVNVGLSVLRFMKTGRC